MLSFILIPKEAQPDIPIPVIVVQVPYPGISPEDSERLLVKPMETYLRSIEGLKTITARAYQGMAVIIMEFDVNFNKEKALEDVRAQVETARARAAPGRQAADRPGIQHQPLPGHLRRAVGPGAGAHAAQDLPATCATS